MILGNSNIISPAIFWVLFKMCTVLVFTFESNPVLFNWEYPSDLAMGFNKHTYV